MRSIAALLVLAGLLPGCVDVEPEPSGPSTHTVSGVVMDAVLRPLSGAQVALEPLGLVNTTATDGTFGFQVPADSGDLVLRAERAGFHPRTVALFNDSAEEWNGLVVELERLPDDTPYAHHLPYEGFIPCSALVVVGHNHGGNAHEDQQTDCSVGAASDNIWEFTVDPRLANAVIEVRWDNSARAEYLAMTIEAVGVNQGDDLQLFFIEGTSPMRGNIGALQAKTHFAEAGGTVRITIEVAGPESDAVASLAVNQEFEAIASLFYVEPGPSDYTVGS